uniref:Uncharacterized protein n=1 Tax=Aegilops tauschii subsp. strangulata TaxID=200361 RepID=A0A453CF56_AEGTS
GEASRDHPGVLRSRGSWLPRPFDYQGGRDGLTMCLLRMIMLVVLCFRVTCKMFGRSRCVHLLQNKERKRLREWKAGPVNIGDSVCRC